MSIDKSELDKLLKAEGMVRGAVFQTDASYVKRHWGEEGLEKLEKKIKELGYSIDYRHSQAMHWYPEGLRAISLLVIKELFGLEMDQIKEMGKEAPKVSFIMKLLARFFMDGERTIRESPKYWAEHHTAGKLTITKLDMKTHKAIARLEEFSLHPVFCKYLEGYFTTVVAFAMRSPSISCSEAKCTFKGDSYHEYHLTWK